MATNQLTDPDNDGALEFTQQVEDVDGDTVAITLELDQIDGTPQSGADRNPSWLQFTTTSVLASGTRKVDIDVEIDASELGEAGNTYTFQISADDGLATTTKTFTLDVVLDDVDGSTMVLIDDNFNFREYTLSTPWDISTWGNETIHNIPNTPSASSGFVLWAFSRNGEHLIMLDRDNGNWHYWILSTPWDLSTATHQGSNSTALGIRYMEIQPGGEFLFGRYTDGVRKYSFDAGNYNPLSGITQVAQLDLSADLDYNAQGFGFSRQGTHLFVHQQGDDVVDGFELPGAYDISGATYEGDHPVPTDNNIMRFTCKSDDGKLYLGSLTNTPDVEEEEFGTPTDVTTLTNEVQITIGNSWTGGPWFGVK